MRFKSIYWRKWDKSCTLNSRRMVKPASKATKYWLRMIWAVAKCEDISMSHKFILTFCRSKSVRFWCHDGAILDSSVVCQNWHKEDTKTGFPRDVYTSPSRKNQTWYAAESKKVASKHLENSREKNVIDLLYNVSFTFRE